MTFLTLAFTVKVKVLLILTPDSILKNKVLLILTPDSIVKNKVLELWIENQAKLQEIADRETLAEIPILKTLHDLLLDKYTEESNSKGISATMITYHH